MPIVNYAKDAPFSSRRPDRAGVALEFSKNFDPNKPAVMVLYFHGHGFAMERDLARQKVVEQFRNSGLNAVLVAPQMMYDAHGDKATARNFAGLPASHAGSLEDSGGVQRFFNQTSVELSKLSGIPPEKFNTMPVVINGYSGGFRASATVLQQAMDAKDKTLLGRIKGVNLMDALFARQDVFARYSNTTNGFVNNSYIPDKKTSTSQNSHELERLAPRVNSFPITSIGHNSLVEGDSKTIGGLGKGLQTASLQSYKETPRGPVVAQSRPAPQNTAVAEANTTTSAPQQQPRKGISSWLYDNLVPERFKSSPQLPEQKAAPASIATAPASPPPAAQTAAPITHVAQAQTKMPAMIRPPLNSR
jgi:hypothetical protein